MTGYTITCPTCTFPNLFVSEPKTYDAAKCPACDSPLTLQADPVDILERLGADRRAMGREVMDRHSFDSYLDGVHGSFKQHIAEAFRVADRANRRNIAQCWPDIAAAHSRMMAS